MQQLVDNRYRLVKPLGSGGMADVYLAHDNILDRDVALKVMSTRYASDEEFVERFKREAQSAAALSHPNIVSIFDRGRSEGGDYYIAMEYVPGGTLRSVWYATERCRPGWRRGWRSRSPTPSRRRTRRASSTATSNPRTSS